MPALPAPFNPQPATAGQALVFTVPDSGGQTRVPIVMLGFALCESTGSAVAKIRFHDGANASAPLLTPVIALAIGESVREWFGDEAVEITSGKVYVEVVSGSVEGVFWWG